MFTSIYDEPSGIWPEAPNAIFEAAIARVDGMNDEIEREVVASRLTRHAIGNLIDRLIAQLDAAEPDTDLEPSFGYLPYGSIDDGEPEDEGDELELASGEGDGNCEDEPSLGAPENHHGGFAAYVEAGGMRRVFWQSASQAAWAQGSADDREDEHDGCEPDYRVQPGGVVPRSGRSA